MIKLREYINEQKNKVISIREYLQFAKAYKASNKHDTLNKMGDRFIQALQKKKITNDDLNKFDYFANLFIKDDNNKKSINNIDKFTLKAKLVDLYKQTKKFGGIKTSNDTSVTYEMGLKNASVFKTMQSLYIMLLSDKMTQAKPPKKEKAKKTIKK